MEFGLKPFGADADFGGGLADHRQSGELVPAFQNEGLKARFEGLGDKFIKAQGTEHGVAANALDRLRVAGDEPGLGAAQEFVTGERDDGDPGLERLLHERFVDAERFEIDEAAGAEIFVDGHREAAEFAQGRLAGEAADVKVRRVNAENKRGAIGDGGPIILNAGAVGGTDLDQVQPARRMMSGMRKPSPISMSSPRETMTS